MSLELRRAVAADCDALFDFVNRPDSLAAKLKTSRPIARDNHEAWFTKRLADPDCRIWILMVDEVAQGQVRFTRSSDGWEIDIYVSSENRRHGLASWSLEQAIDQFHREHPRARLVARAKPGNSASQLLFQSFGFRKMAEAPDYFTYVLSQKESEAVCRTNE
jgi:RimJ/RimL family protein N-acetyltransferase